MTLSKFRTPLDELGEHTRSLRRRRVSSVQEQTRDKGCASCGSVLASPSYFRSAWRDHACCAWILLRGDTPCSRNLPCLNRPSASLKNEKRLRSIVCCLERVHGEIVALLDTFPSLVRPSFDAQRIHSRRRLPSRNVLVPRVTFLACGTLAAVVLFSAVLR
jgi:hypothetical protein